MSDQCQGVRQQPIAPRRLRDLWTGPMENLIPAFLRAEIHHAATRLFPRHDP